MTLLDQFNQMLQAHNDFIQSMSGIAYSTNNKEMQEAIFAHIKKLRAILDEEPVGKTYKSKPRHDGLDHTDMTQDIVGNSPLS